MVSQTHNTASTDQSSAAIEKLYMEKTLLRISGALFCHDAKRARTRTAEIELNRGVTEKQIVIRPDPRLGQPGRLAHKIFVAIIKKHPDYGRPVQSDVSFTKRELMRLIGRAKWGGSANEQLTRALNEIHYAFIRAKFKGSDGRHVEQSFTIFPEVYLERAEFATDPIEKCVVTLARPIIASLQDGHFTCLNHALMQQLGTIGQALYMRLFFHFANLYDGHHRTRLAFPKRYDDICAEWLGGLVAHKHPSIIERDQLGPHLRQLTGAGFLASYHITKAASGDGFIVTFRPGAAFFVDYDRFYRGRRQGDLQFNFHTDRSEIAEPLRVAYLFIEKRTGQPLKDIPYVSSKEVDTAKQFLARVAFAEIPDFLDYALAEARKTKFDVQTLGGLKQYLPAYFQTRERREATRTAAQARRATEREEALQLAYDRFRRSSADAVFASLPAAEQATIEAMARGLNGAGFAARSGPLATTLFEITRARVTIERHGAKVPSFEQWRATRRAA
jgi:hypothetical protein